MPVKQLPPKRPTPEAQLLKERLVVEWRDSNSTAVQPIILEEPGAVDDDMHVYVVWDNWAGIPNVERSEIIMDAFIERYGQEKSLNVRVAMGLTPGEADRLGIPYR